MTPAPTAFSETHSASKGRQTQGTKAGLGPYLEFRGGGRGLREIKSRGPSDFSIHVILSMSGFMGISVTEKWGGRILAGHDGTPEPTGSNPTLSYITSD